MIARHGGDAITVTMMMIATITGTAVPTIATVRIPYYFIPVSIIHTAYHTRRFFNGNDIIISKVGG